MRRCRRMKSNWTAWKGNIPMLEMKNRCWKKQQQRLQQSKVRQSVLQYWRSLFIESERFVFLAAITSAIKNTTSHCGRFQFQCHSGECIAVYNACDGIPQCEDGSDEGPEVSILLIWFGACTELNICFSVPISNTSTWTHTKQTISWWSWTCAAN